MLARTNIFHTFMKLQLFLRSNYSTCGEIKILLLYLLQLIEKRRRDRINSCLVELRRLVPAAVEKQVGTYKKENYELSIHQS